MNGTGAARVRVNAGITPELIETDVAIETPEHIVFRHRLAGPGRRAFAHLLDQLICLGVFIGGLMLTGVIVAALGAATADPMDLLGTAQGLLLLLVFVIEWVYFVVLESWKGASLGKLALGMQVVTTSGQPIGFSHAALRNLLRVADAMPLPYAAGVLSLFVSALSMLYPTGVIAMLATRRFQRIGDLVAGTMVVVVRAERARPIEVAPPTAEEAAQLPPVLAIDADERKALELFLRRKKLGRPREEELASMIAPTLARKYGVWLPDPVRLLAVLYDRARAAGRGEGPPSSRGGAGWL